MRISCEFGTGSASATGTMTGTLSDFHTSPPSAPLSPLSPLTPSSTGILDTPATPPAHNAHNSEPNAALPHLDLHLSGLGGIEDKPFSTNFDDLLEGLGLAHPSIAEAATEGSGIGRAKGKGASGIAIHELPDIDDMMASPDWPHRGSVLDFSAGGSGTLHTAMPISMSMPMHLPLFKRPGGPLSIIHEELGESPVITVPTACLADFEFDFDAFDSPHSDNCYGNASQGGTPSISMRNATVCIRRDTGIKFLMKRKRTCPSTLRMLHHAAGTAGSSGSGTWMEQTILETLTTLGVPFVAAVRWSFHSGEHNYIIMDHLTNGNLVDLINTNGPLASHQAIFYAAELISGLSHLHTNGIVHRSVEPRSIVISNTGHILLTDFSNAGFLTQSSTTSQRVVDFSKAEKSSVAYNSPELLLGWAHDAKVDWWSFGVVFYFLVFGYNPFEGQDNHATHTGIYERILRSPISVESMRLVHPMARDLILKCLERNPSIRWGVDQIKGHAYFSATDWDQVSQMKLEVPALSSSPLVKSPPPVVKSSVFQLPYSLNPTVRDSQRHLPLGFNLDIYSRQDIAKETMRQDSLQDIAKVVERCKPAPRVLDAVQEDDPISRNSTGSNVNVDADSVADRDKHGTSGTDGIDLVPRTRQPEDTLTKSERISRFWDEIDKEERAGGMGGSDAPSLNSMEFGGGPPGLPYTKAPKLRKHHSALQARHRLFNISTSSFHNILRWKPRSATTLRDGQKRSNNSMSQQDLPMGVHQMGSGIGFTYNVPTAVPSKLSMCSIVPPCHIFSKRFSVPFQRVSNGGILSNSTSSINDKAKPGQSLRQHGEFSVPSCDPEPSAIDLPQRERNNQPVELSAPVVIPPRVDLAAQALSRNAGNSTFIRDMYRSPGWIVAPPEVAPSPMPLVNTKTSTSPIGRHARRASISVVSSETMSPATLVNSASLANTSASHQGEADEETDDCHINIVIPKSLGFEFDFPNQHWARGSTLRLVPQPTGSERGGFDQSYDDSADISMCTMAARGAL